jgi:hypothetical protein
MIGSCKARRFVPTTELFSTKWYPALPTYEPCKARRFAPAIELISTMMRPCSTSLRTTIIGSCKARRFVTTTELFFQRCDPALPANEPRKAR